MKPILYKVETYIVPETNNLSVLNEIDDLKCTNQFNVKRGSIFENNYTQNEEDASLASYNKPEEFAKFSNENSKLIGIKLVKGITNKNETLHDEHFDDDIIKYYNDESSCRPNERVRYKTEFQGSIGSEETLYPARQFSKVNSLMSIDERSENSLDTKLNDFCHHGYKNGCTASIPSPEEVSEDIFRENWLQKIEILRNRETILREKEINLQKKERALFRKEKELRITERLLNEKMKQADQQLKYQRDALVEKRLEKVAQILSGDIEQPDNIAEEKIMKKDDAPKEENIPKKEEMSKKEEIPRIEEISGKEEIPRKEEILKKEEIPRKIEIPRKAEVPKKAEAPKNLQPIINSCERKEEKVVHPMRSNSSLRKSFSSKTHSYATIRYRERSKINYDDLNSTLSAASVDTLNTRTSLLFDPALYKKPHVFTRSASERWTKMPHKDTAGKLHRVIEEKSEHMIEEEKIFRKVSDNICALQEKETRFQNYGLVDCIPAGIPVMAELNDDEDRLSSYLDLEIGHRHSRRDLASTSSKDRPVSWASETNEWLQKTRQMHNPATKQLVENKENVVCNTRCIDKKKAKKTKSKKFFLFR